MGRTAWALALAAGMALEAGATQRCDEVQANGYATGSQSRPAVAALADGRFVATWASDGSPGTDSDDRSIQARIFDAAGAPTGPQFQVNTWTTGRQTSPHVAVDAATGRFLVVWDGIGSAGDDTSAQSIQARLFEADGNPIGSDVQVNSFTTSTQRDPRAAPRPGGGFVVVWESNGSPGTDTDGFSVLGRTVSAAGVPEAADFQVSVHTTSYQIDPAVAASGAGFLVVWVSDGSPGTDVSSTSVLARRLDAAGVPLATDFQVNAWTTSFQDGPRVAPDDAGGFVVAWQSNGSAGGDDDYGSVQARHVSAAGVLGTESQVNVWTAGDQRALAIASDGAGGLVATWTSEGGTGTDGDGWSIQGRDLAPSGIPSQGQFQVNALESGDQYGPHLAGAGGTFVVVWRSATGSTGDTDGAVQLRRLALGSCDGGTTTTTVTTSSTSSSTTSTVSTTSSTSSTVATTSSTATTVPVSTTTSSSAASTITTTSTTTSTSAPASTSSTATTSTATSTTATTIPSTTTTTAGSTTSTTLAPRQPLAGRKLVLREARTGRRQRPATALLVVRDPMLQAAFDDGVPSSAAARVVSLAGAFDLRASLDPDEWRTRRRALRYRDDDGTRLVLARGRKLRLRLAGGELALGDVAPTPIVAELTLGTHRFCVVFTDAALSTRRGRLVARRHDAAAACPDVPEAAFP